MEVFFMFVSVFSILLLAMMARILWHNTKTIYVEKNMLKQEDLPTVSICIPARNENNALNECLSSVISSQYPKLEILVLDDCSQDKTSQVIRGFSHEGVRFIQGQTPSDGWLGKNNAYATLYEQARGKYIVFMSVDTRIYEDTIQKLVGYMETQKLAMASVLPSRDRRYISSIVFAPMRYFWQLALSGKRNPPVSTSLWAVSADSLNKDVALDDFKQDILLENSLARLFAEQKSFKFIQADGFIKATYAKHWNSQIQTSIRLLYPMLKRSYIISVFAALFFILASSSPFILIALASTVQATGIALVQIVLMICLYLAYSYVITRSIHLALLSTLCLPFVICQESYLIVASSIKYARGEVNWKGRNICFPSSPRFTEKS